MKFYFFNVKYRCLIEFSANGTLGRIGPLGRIQPQDLGGVSSPGLSWWIPLGSVQPKVALASPGSLIFLGMENDLWGKQWEPKKHTVMLVT